MLIFFQGLREGTFAFVIVVWIYIVTKSEMALGTYGLVASAVQFAAYYTVTRLIKESFRKKIDSNRRNFAVRCYFYYRIRAVVYEADFLWNRHLDRLSAFARPLHFFNV